MSDDVVTKFPTTTTTIVAGWNNPTNAFVEDGVNTDSSTDGAEQKYGGWNFTTSDIPEGSTITKVEFGAKHYEVDPSGYHQYTTLKYVDSSGTSHTIDLAKCTALTWGWWDITSYESTWDLTKLNNADCRIICKLVKIGEGCYTEDTYFIKKVNGEYEFVNVKDVKAGDMLHCYFWSEKRFGFVKVVNVEVYDTDTIIKFVLQPFRLKSKVTNELFEYRPHMSFTSSHPHIILKRPENVKPSDYDNYLRLRLTTMEVYDRILYGDELYLPCLLKMSGKIVAIKIERCELIKRKTKAYKVLLENPDALLSLEEFHPDDLRFLSRHGFKMEKFTDEFPLPVIKGKETAYVDAVALRVTFTPPVAGQYYNLGDGLTQTVTFV